MERRHGLVWVGVAVQVEAAGGHLDLRQTYELITSSLPELVTRRSQNDLNDKLVHEWETIETRQTRAPELKARDQKLQCLLRDMTIPTAHL